MTFSKLLFTAALTASFALPLAARADTAGCELNAFKANRVEPLRVQERFSRTTIERLAGAQVFVPAQQGLTTEWLRAKVEQHIAGMRHHSMAGCPLSVSGIKVAVISGGTGFWVQIKAENSETALKVLRLAQSAVH